MLNLARSAASLPSPLVLSQRLQPARRVRRLVIYSHGSLYHFGLLQRGLAVPLVATVQALLTFHPGPLLYCVQHLFQDLLLPLSQFEVPIFNPALVYPVPKCSVVYMQRCVKMFFCIFLIPGGDSIM